MITPVYVTSLVLWNVYRFVQRNWREQLSRNSTEREIRERSPAAKIVRVSVYVQNVFNIIGTYQ